MTEANFKSPAMDRLFEGVLSLEKVGECYAFFEDLCTINELLALAQRFEVATMLKEGQTYNTIEKKTGASTATISRVKRFLNYGAGGYNLVLERLKEKESK